jgi:hypothetical protein
MGWKGWVWVPVRVGWALVQRASAATAKVVATAVESVV